LSRAGSHRPQGRAEEVGGYPIYSGIDTFSEHRPLILTSPHMVAKQREMDGIIRQIYTAMESEEHLRSTLLVFCGDHGMNDAGNHGASSAGETSPALVFISPHLRSLTGG